VIFVLVELGCAGMDISAALSAVLLVSGNAAIACYFSRAPRAQRPAMMPARR
jgi:hypothetical protein